jgi:hypothetical protein
MTAGTRGRFRAFGWIAAGLVLGAGGRASAQEPAPAPAPRPAPTPAQSVAFFGALRDLDAALARENAGLDRRPVEAILRELGRPPRTVSDPALTPAAVDALLEAALAAGEAAKAPRATDEDFLRRACLDLTGRPPTPEQVTGFLADADPAKRAKLVDALLDSDAHAARWGRYWRDAVAYRATNQQVQRFAAAVFGPLEAWLTGQFAANRPWDEIVTALITAEGDTRTEGPPLFTFAHADQVRIPPAEVAGEVSRLFLGVQISCAQCHDHPTDRWKRRQFHEFAAFFAGSSARPNGQPIGQYGFSVVTTEGRPRYAMTDLEDPDRTTPITPRFFLAPESAATPAESLGAPALRAVVASYVTGQDNPLFARAFVNRMWAELVGEGFNAPIDDMGPDHPATYPEVLDALASAFARGGYDVKWLLRTIATTEAYGRAVPTGDRPGAAMAAGCTSRLDAGQIYEALKAAGVPFEAAARRFAAGAGAGGANPQAAAALRRAGPRGLFDGLFGVDPSQPDDEVFGTIPQALFLMNSPVIDAAARANPRNALGMILKDHPADDRAATEALYLRVLARRPTDAELDTVAAYLEGVPSRVEGFEDLYWSLLNSAEFVSRK